MLYLPYLPVQHLLCHFSLYHVCTVCHTLPSPLLYSTTWLRDGRRSVDGRKINYSVSCLLEDHVGPGRSLFCLTFYSILYSITWIPNLQPIFTTHLHTLWPIHPSPAHSACPTHILALFPTHSGHVPTACPCVPVPLYCHTFICGYPPCLYPCHCPVTLGGFLYYLLVTLPTMPCMWR